MNKKIISPRVITLVGLCIALNIVGSNLALMLKLPIYLDTIGTILSAALLGPLGGMITGLLTGTFVGLTTDMISLYYIPVQLVIGLVAGLLYRRILANDVKNVWWVAFLISVPGTVFSTAITYYLFHGVTSSGSNILVQILAGIGVNKFLAILLVQVITDYCDRLVGVYTVVVLFNLLKNKFPVKLSK
ncbi:ECF transporter S component [Ligilactobacillus sp. WILCCON 0076]|uniref:ECF transporter S component n=1 Tax=Ligilactobacillus ubinensis TaxID=2876789 RepID=A0A9X2FKQ1_9LACO|nr:ECF transporter S component [Ligilactobacillus ubinensis]MCP0886128.1 ECF transporter S component [Ligilactobacillus ubinensis]